MDTNVGIAEVLSPSIWDAVAREPNSARKLTSKPGQSLSSSHLSHNRQRERKSLRQTPLTTLGYIFSICFHCFKSLYNHYQTYNNKPSFFHLFLSSFPICYHTVVEHFTILHSEHLSNVKYPPFQNHHVLLHYHCPGFPLRLCFCSSSSSPSLPRLPRSFRPRLPRQPNSQHRGCNFRRNGSSEGLLPRANIHQHPNSLLPR